MSDGLSNNKEKKSINIDEGAVFKPLELLNEYQKQAVVCNDKALLVNAGVGSGKTTVLVHKILYLHHVRKVSVSDMVVLTFTNKAAEEIKERVFASGLSSGEELHYFGTFHSVARHLLMEVLPVEKLGYTREFSILDDNGLLEMLEGIIKRNNLKIKYIKRLEKRFIEYKDGKRLYGNMKHDDDIDRLVELVEEEKLKRNLMDFDDLIENCGKLLKMGYFKPSWVIIDEFQDTDSSQLLMVDGLIGEDTHVFAVGDPNQIIYSWRGSRQDIFEIFKEKYDASVKALPINYRSTGIILEAARALLKHPSSLEGIRDRGNAIVIKRHYNSFNEALYLADRIKKLHDGGVPYSEIAVFYRKVKQSAVFEDVFKRENIPFEVSVKKSFKDIPVLYWLNRLLRASLNVRDTDSLIHACTDKRYGAGLTVRDAVKELENVQQGKEHTSPLMQKILQFREWALGVKLERSIGENIYGYFDMDEYLSPTSISFAEDRNYVLKYLAQLEEFISIRRLQFLQGISEAVENSMLYGCQVVNQAINPGEDSVKLMTLHASKGLEFRYVFISGANSGIIPVGGRLDDEEEKRLFFVGITRARDYLEISYHSNTEDYGALPIPSPFLRLIPDEIIESEELKSRAHKLSDLRKEIRSSMEKKQGGETKKQRVYHDKYGEGFIISETDELITVEFDSYGEKSFSRLFCPLKYIT
jgi:DNA helicase-2/ATP-dependent DNA helicase PcrA